MTLKFTCNGESEKTAMGLEIERKFLVDPKFVKNLRSGFLIRQGYLETVGLVTVRARIKGNIGFLTLKGEPEGNGMIRSEFEYEIPISDARQIIDTLCGNRIIEKTRFELVMGTAHWEIDVFHGKNDGLVIAEIELEEPGISIEVPEWVVTEVTGDFRYHNSRLSQYPWPEWKER